MFFPPEEQFLPFSQVIEIHQKKVSNLIIFLAYFD